MENNIKKCDSINNKEFISIIDDLINSETVQEMKKYRQQL